MVFCIDSNCIINYDRIVLNRKDEFIDFGVEWFDKFLFYSEWYLLVNILCWFFFLYVNYVLFLLLIVVNF